MSLWKDPNGCLHDDMDGQALGLSTWPQGMTKISDSQAQALLTPTAAQQWASYLAAAKYALEGTSSTMERIIEAVSLGKTTLTTPDVVVFMEYRASLRSILNQLQPETIPESLPLRPAYPANT